MINWSWSYRVHRGKWVSHSSARHINTCIFVIFKLNTLASGCFRGFSGKNA